MSDFAAFTDMLFRMDVAHKVDVDEQAQVATVTLRAQHNKIEGYAGFYCDFYFSTVNGGLTGVMIGE